MDTTKATAVLFDFDGVVAAAGGYVTVGDKVIAHHVYGQNLLQKVLDTVGDNDTGLIFQTCLLYTSPSPRD